jgi:3-oxoacyl-[acyl-carrier-protein] synthase III
LPSARAVVATDFDRLHLSPLQARVYSRLYGFNEVPVAAPEGEFAMLEAAVRRVVDQSGVDPKDIRLVVHAHTGPYIGPVGQSVPRRLVRVLGPHVLGFGMQLHKCVSSMTALHLIDRLLRSYPPAARAVLLLGEAADSKDLRVLETGIVGDVACAVLLSRSGVRDRVVAQSIQIHGQHARGIYAAANSRERQEYDAEFQDNLLSVIRCVLDQGGVALANVRFVLPHNVNINVWLKVARRLGIDRERVHLVNIGRYGHCFGADVFMNLADVRSSLASGDFCVMASAAVGGVFGATLLQH